MPTWNSPQYLKFERERTQPSLDLAARINLQQPARIIDLGCGPGNSTAVLARRWPDAAVTGLDSSPEMIASARAASPGITWVEGDLATWKADAPYDVVFSNAALQWVGGHGELLPHLLGQVAPGGALAAQMPANYDSAPHRIMRELAASAAWSSRFASPVRQWAVEPPEFYYNALAPLAAGVELWLTDYMHILDGPKAILEWYRGTGMRPYLDRLEGSDERERFEGDFLREVTAVYPRQNDGRVLFPFRRLFFVASVNGSFFNALQANSPTQSAYIK